MVFIARGIIWYGLYLFLILLPLGTALVSNPDRTAPSFLTSLGIAAGFIGFALMALEFSLISRIKSAAEPFGEDSLQLFHNIMGVIALGFILAHPTLLIISEYPANCWLNPFSACANTATIAAALSVYVLILLIMTSLFRERLGIKYEVWYVAHGLFALFVVFAALVHIFTLGRFTSAPIMKVVWILYAALVLTLLSWHKIYTPIRNWRKKWKVIENKAERGGAHTLALEPLGHKGFEFLPGQFAWLKTGRTPFGIGQHPISISSSNSMICLRFSAPRRPK